MTLKPRTAHSISVHSSRNILKWFDGTHPHNLSKPKQGCRQAFTSLHLTLESSVWSGKWDSCRLVFMLPPLGLMRKYITGRGKENSIVCCLYVRVSKCFFNVGKGTHRPFGAYYKTPGHPFLEKAHTQKTFVDKSGQLEAHSCIPF